MTLARRAALNPPARAARAAELSGLSPLSQLLPNGLTVCALLQVAASPGITAVCKKLVKRHD